LRLTGDISYIFFKAIRFLGARGQGQ
jgi:hypothetical protein